MMPLLRALWLAAALLCTQMAFAAHGIGHAFERDHDADQNETACVECLVLAGFLSVPPVAVPPLSAPAPHAPPAVSAVSPAPTFARHTPFRSRAPPPLQS